MGNDLTAVWTALNERQQFYLGTIYDADQAKESERAAAGAAGKWDRIPCSAAFVPRVRSRSAANGLDS
ncbi:MULTISPECIES: hypothetical protein [Kitasatospora]|uniref:Uncharacterized protein n=1 Tax=Kitasatospora cystarginea TaxID=58350 RepID=A0ABP5RQM0_9ACTN